MDISYPEQQEQMNDRAEARRQGIALGNYSTQLLHQVLQRNIGTNTAAKRGQWYRFMQMYIPMKKLKENYKTLHYSTL